MRYLTVKQLADLARITKELNTAIADKNLGGFSVSSVRLAYSNGDDFFVTQLENFDDGFNVRVAEDDDE